MLRRILIALLALIVVVLVVADRVGAAVSGHVLADKIQTDEHLSSRPDVHVGGIPFLTQAFGGSYSDVSVTARHLVVDRVPVTELVAHLHGAHIPLGKAIRGDVHQVPVDRADGKVTLSYADIDRYLAPKQLSVREGANGTVRVTAHASVAGSSIAASGIGEVSVSGNVVHVTVTKVSGAAQKLGQTAQSASVSFSLPLLGLPFRLELGQVSSTSTGLVATGTVHHLVLGRS